MNPPRLLGVDGGGTSTTAWLADLDGFVNGRGFAGPSNLKAVGEQAARSALNLAIASCFRDAGEDVGPVAVACLGLAGFARPEDQRLLTGWASDAGWSGRLLLVNDGDLALAAGTPEGWGLAVIAGTGSIAVGRTREGRTTRAGGWGPLFGDEGSGYAVALAGLRRVAHRADGRRPRSTGGDPLTDRICSAMGIADPSELVAAIYRAEVDRPVIASLAKEVVLASVDDPSIVVEILDPAGVELARMVESAARSLGFDSGSIPLALAGSFLLNAEVVAHRMLLELVDRGFQARPTLVPEPVQGALVLARRAMTS